MGGRGGDGKPGWGGGLTKMTHFKIRAGFWIVALVLAKIFGAETATLIAIGIFLGGILMLSHPWEMSSGLRSDPRLVSVQVVVASFLGALLLVTLTAGVPKFGPYTDGVARSVANIPDPNINLQNPLNQSPVAGPTTAPPSTLPAIPGQ